MPDGHLLTVIVARLLHGARRWRAGRIPNRNPRCIDKPAGYSSGRFDTFSPFVGKPAYTTDGQSRTTVLARTVLSAPYRPWCPPLPSLTVGNRRSHLQSSSGLCQTGPLYAAAAPPGLSTSTVPIAILGDGSSPRGSSDIGQIGYVLGAARRPVPCRLSSPQTQPILLIKP